MHSMKLRRLYDISARTKDLGVHFCNFSLLKKTNSYVNLAYLPIKSDY